MTSNPEKMLREAMQRANSYISAPTKYGGWAITVHFENAQDSKKLKALLDEATRRHGA